jgi:hypothetical protein
MPRFADLTQGQAFLIDGVGPYLKIWDVDNQKMKALSLISFEVWLCPNDLEVKCVRLDIEEEEIKQ